VSGSPDFHRDSIEAVLFGGPPRTISPRRRRFGRWRRCRLRRSLTHVRVRSLTCSSTPWSRASDDAA